MKRNFSGIILYYLDDQICNIQALGKIGGALQGFVFDIIKFSFDSSKNNLEKVLPQLQTETDVNNL